MSVKLKCGGGVGEMELVAAVLVAYLLSSLRSNCTVLLAVLKIEMK